MSVLQNYIKGGKASTRVVLCESFDQRVIRAADTLMRQKLAQVVLLGNYNGLEANAARYGIDLKGMEVVDYETKDMQNNIKADLERMSPAAQLDSADPVTAGAWLVRRRMADAVIAGAAASPSHVMRIFLRVLGIADDCRTMSGMSLVVFAGHEFVRSQTVGMADVSAVPNPTAQQLADIAIQSAANYERLTGNAAKIGFLSFATAAPMGRKHPSIQKIRDAIEKVRAAKPNLTVDGEMQIDAALIPAVAGIKSPSSAVAGSANVLVFPSLEAGNIAMKIFQKFSHYSVLGPVLQGTKYRCTYVPRASSAEDILDQIGMLVSLSS